MTNPQARTKHRTTAQITELCLQSAEDYHQQSLAIYRETGGRYGEGLALNNLGTIYQELRQRDRAAECWQEAASGEGRAVARRTPRLCRSAPVLLTELLTRLVGTGETAWDVDDARRADYQVSETRRDAGDGEDARQ